MFTTYIDDSGTAPGQKMAVAAGVVIPAHRIASFESEWNKLLREEGINDLHASPCHAKVKEFGSWSDDDVRRVFTRARKLTIRFSVSGFCIGIHKADYDQVLTADLKAAVGTSHFTWALSSLVGLGRDLAESQKEKMHFVIASSTDKVQNREIADAMEFSEEHINPGNIRGYWQSAKAADVPGLQAADLFAWTCYRQFLRSRFNDPTTQIMEELNHGYAEARRGTWRTIQSLSREGIEKWVAENAGNRRTSEIVAFKQQLRQGRMPKAKAQKNNH